jgi:6-phospho-beta-glucosidase
MQTEGNAKAREKSESVYDMPELWENQKIWDTAIDEFKYLDVDLDLMKEAGFNFYRFSVSWSRIVHDGDGEINKAGFEFYDRLVDGCLKRNIEPMICLYHFDMPKKLAEKYDGLLSDKTVQAFINYSKSVIDHFSDKVKYWIAFNEQNLYLTSEAPKIAGCLSKITKDKNKYLEKSYLNAVEKIFDNTVKCHNSVAEYIKEINQKYSDDNALKLGAMIAYEMIYPCGNDGFVDPFNALVAYKTGELLNWKTLDETIYDFISFSYYRSSNLEANRLPKKCPANFCLDFTRQNNPALDVTKWGWSVDPIGFRLAISTMYAKYKKPIFPIENGIGLDDTLPDDKLTRDVKRIGYHSAHIEAMYDAMKKDGADVMGYLGWGLIDIPSSQGDMNKRYGIVYVNRDNDSTGDMKRYPKKSYGYFQDMIKDYTKKINQLQNER